MNSPTICCWLVIVLFVAVVLIGSYGAIQKANEETQLRRRLLEELEED